MDDTTEAVSRQSLWRAAEPLWIAALGAQFIVLGGLLLPRVIRLLGRGGAVETVEWAVYMSTLFVFPVAVWIIGWVIPRVLGERAAVWVRRGLVSLMVIEFAVYAALRATPILLVMAILASIATLDVRYFRAKFPVAILAVAGACALAGWMAAGGLVYWSDARQWLSASVVTIAVLVGALLLIGAMLRAWIQGGPRQAARARTLDLLPLSILVAFSFRTFPVVEFYHWGFFVGPIEQLRQGGTLLWDTPSQYGFLSILLPTLLPGSAWKSFWFFQSLLYAAVGCMMYLAIRRLASGWVSAVVAFLITFTTLFFRPRTAELLLPAQMTPAAGPFRFIWCFVMLAFLVEWYRRRDSEMSSGRFVIIGTAIWVISILWSAETAIYVTAIWFPAYLIQTLQTGKGARFIIGRAALPFVAMVVAGIAVSIAYVAGTHFVPDIGGYFEYVLLYSRGGFGALPIDPTGTIWYLVLSFLIVSTLLVLHALKNPRDPRLVVWAAAWGAIWSASSYFTGRSHPVNLIALIPLLIYTIVACMQLRPFGDSSRGRFAMAAALLPMLAMPVALTAGHEMFPRAVIEKQLPVSRFTEQVPLMDPELQSLLVAAGAKPTDSFVLAGDGRLMLPAWNSAGLPTAMRNPDGTRVVSTKSWLPKAFEIIGSLPESRRQVYFERNARNFPAAGWLIQSKSLTANGSDHLLRFVHWSRREERSLDNDKWIVSWMGPVPRVSD